MTKIKTTQKQKKDEGRSIGTILFDVLMGDIEPELTTAYNGRLAELYADETKEEYATRVVRYQKAYEEFFSIWEDLATGFPVFVQETYKKITDDIKASNTLKEKDVLEALGEELDQFEDIS